MTYFRLVAEEVRHYMAALGMRRFDELIGRVDLLVPRAGETPRQQRLDLSPLVDEDGVDTTKPQRCLVTHNASFDKGELAETMLNDMLPAIETGGGGEYHYAVRNSNRSLGARISGEIARRYGEPGLEHNPLTVRCRGTSGQSFGVWNAGGLHLYLEGDANDYVGKGMAGGRIVVYPPPDSCLASQENVIMGNTCLYGATGGRLYAAGRVGERFAVRNSGAVAVVEGAGDHCCEYMTGGVVVLLGDTGLNFGAGMTGGFAFVYDRHNTFADRYNHELLDICRIDTENTGAHRKLLKELVNTFVKETGSVWGQALVDDYDACLGKFWLAKPRSASLDALFDIMVRAA
jgi:glutamate synthase (NADPH/NADH) large chain